MLGIVESLAHTSVALHDKAAVELHQVGYPVEYQQVVAYGDLRERKSGPDKAQIEERGIEHLCRGGW